MGANAGSGSQAAGSLLALLGLRGLGLLLALLLVVLQQRQHGLAIGALHKCQSNERHCARTSGQTMCGA